MPRLYSILCFLVLANSYAQAPVVTLQNGVFDAVTVSIPTMKPEKFVDITKAWAQSFTRNEGGYDASNITANTITVSALKRNAFRYQNVGEVVENKIRYSLEISFTATGYTVKFVVNDIYGDNDNLLDYKLPDYYTSGGSLKEGYDGIEQTIQKTATDIIQSHYDHILNYR
jgi:hypothetical protein